MPHSDILGSKPVCGSPELFAAYHVLHRHLAPRHSPYALSSLTIDMRTNVVLPDSFCVLSSGVNPSFGTLRVFCGRKKLPFAGYSIVKELFLIRGNIAPRNPSAASGRFPRTPWLASLVGPQSPTPFARRNFLFYLRRPSAGGVGPTVGRGAGVEGPPRSGGCRRHPKTKQSGEYRARTGDLLVANQALSQLS